MDGPPRENQECRLNRQRQGGHSGGGTPAPAPQLLNHKLAILRRRHGNQPDFQETSRKKCLEAGLFLLHECKRCHYCSLQISNLQNKMTRRCPPTTLALVGSPLPTFFLPRCPWHPRLLPNGTLLVCRGPSQAAKNTALALHGKPQSVSQDGLVLRLAGGQSEASSSHSNGA